MIDLPALRTRVERLRDLAHGMGKEVAIWQAQEGPLLNVERKKYLEAVYGGNAATDEAARVLEAALGWLEKLIRETGGPLP